MKNAVKYPRTPHLPWSPGATDDDIHLSGLQRFEGKEVVVTEKMDGENSSLYRDGIHARSIDGRAHPSRDWVKRWHAVIAFDIPEGWRFCGENVYARHSLGYEDLQHYFYLFSVWTDENVCLSWAETEEWAGLLGCALPRVICQGEWDEELIRSIEIDETREEGYVMRTSGGFAFDQFRECIAKWVRPNHVQTDQHWMNAKIIPNLIKNSE